MNKLLITGSTFPRWEGDTEPRFILDYAKAMSKYYDVTVMTPAAVGAADEEILEGVKVIRCHYFPIRKWETLCSPGAIMPRIREKKVRILLVPFLLLSLRIKLGHISGEYDMVHSNWIVPMGICQSGIKKTPFVVTGHGGDVASLNFWPVTAYKKRTYRRAKAITVVSKALGEYIKNSTGDIYHDKTSVIPMGCDISAFGPEHRRENFFGQGDKKVVLFVGRLAEKKGVTYLIEAMRNVSGAVLCIAGKGDLEEELRQQAEALNAEVSEERVRFLGPKTHEQLADIYASADVFAMPSVVAKDGDKEGFGLVLLEAMASGLPVVASRSGGIPEVVTDGVNGYLCEERNPDDIAKKIEKVLFGDKAATEKMVAEGYKTAHENSYEIVAQRYYELMKK